MISEQETKSNNIITNFFKDISIGSIPSEIINLLKDNVSDMHDKKSEETQNQDDYIEDIFGLKIKNAKNVYVPKLYSSSIFMIRSIFSKFDSYKLRYKSVLEIGAGTGVIGLSLYNHNKFEKLYFTDISKESVDCCLDNINNNFPYSKNIEVIQSDLFNSEKIKGHKFDCIILSPPFCHFKELDSEGDISLTDLDGKLVTKFFDEASEYLNEDGEIWFSYSNISYPSILKKFSSKFNFELALLEYSSESGIIIFSYRAKLII